MTSHSYEEAVRSLQKGIEYQNHKFIELQQMMVMNSNMNHDMEHIRKEHQKITKELEESKVLNDQQQKNFTEEIQKNKKQISTLEMAAFKQKLDYRKVLKLAEDRKGQNEQLKAKIIQLEEQLESKQKLELENQQLKGKLDVMKNMEAEFLKMVDDLDMDLREKERSLQDLEEFNKTLIVKERLSNDELQKARTKLIKGMEETSSCRANIGVKRMGELDTRPFLKAVSMKNKKYNKGELAQRASELCSLWENYLRDYQLRDSHWYPFKIIKIEGKEQEIINDEDERLKRLKKEVSVGAYNAVVAALTEMNEYNPSGRSIVTELWNQRLGRRANLEEGIEFLLSQRRTKRRKTSTQVVNNVNLKG